MEEDAHFGFIFVYDKNVFKIQSRLLIKFHLFAIYENIDKPTVIELNLKNWSTRIEWLVH